MVHHNPSNLSYMMSGNGGSGIVVMKVTGGGGGGGDGGGGGGGGNIEIPATTHEYRNLWALQGGFWMKSVPQIFKLWAVEAVADTLLVAGAGAEV